MTNEYRIEFDAPCGFARIGQLGLSHITIRNHRALGYIEADFVDRPGAEDGMSLTMTPAGWTQLFNGIRAATSVNRLTATELYWAAEILERLSRDFSYPNAERAEWSAKSLRHEANIAYTAPDGTVPETTTDEEITA